MVRLAENINDISGKVSLDTTDYKAAEGYAKAMSETAKAQGPIDVPFEVKEQEVEDAPADTEAE